MSDNTRLRRKSKTKEYENYGQQGPKTNGMSKRGREIFEGAIREASTDENRKMGGRRGRNRQKGLQALFDAMIGTYQPIHSSQQPSPAPSPSTSSQQPHKHNQQATEQQNQPHPDPRPYPHHADAQSPSHLQPNGYGRGSRSHPSQHPHNQPRHQLEQPPSLQPREENKSTPQHKHPDPAELFPAQIEHHLHHLWNITFEKSRNPKIPDHERPIIYRDSSKAWGSDLKNPFLSDFNFFAELKRSYTAKYGNPIQSGQSTSDQNGIPNNSASNNVHNNIETLHEANGKIVNSNVNREATYTATNSNNINNIINSNNSTSNITTNNNNNSNNTSKNNKNKRDTNGPNLDSRTNGKSTYRQDHTSAPRRDSEKYIPKEVPTTDETKQKIKETKQQVKETMQQTRPATKQPTTPDTKQQEKKQQTKQLETKKQALTDTKQDKKQDETRRQEDTKQEETKQEDVKQQDIKQQDIEQQDTNQQSRQQEPSKVETQQGGETNARENDELVANGAYNYGFTNDEYEEISDPVDSQKSNPGDVIIDIPDVYDESDASPSKIIQNGKASVKPKNKKPKKGKSKPGKHHDPEKAEVKNSPNNNNTFSSINNNNYSNNIISLTNGNNEAWNDILGNLLPRPKTEIIKASGTNTLQLDNTTGIITLAQDTAQARTALLHGIPREVVRVFANRSSKSSSSTDTLPVKWNSGEGLMTAGRKFPMELPYLSLKDMFGTSRPTSKLSCANLKCQNTTSEDKPFKSCAKCNMAAYCSRECQVEDWAKRHKQTCKSNAAEEQRKTFATQKFWATASIRHMMFGKGVVVIMCKDFLSYIEDDPSGRGLYMFYMPMADLMSDDCPIPALKKYQAEFAKSFVNHDTDSQSIAAAAVDSTGFVTSHIDDVKVLQLKLHKRSCKEHDLQKVDVIAVDAHNQATLYTFH